MKNHTGAGGVCQPLGDDAIPKTPPPHADRRLVTRYGAAALDDGYVAIPRVVIRRRHALTVTAAEWDYICEVWSYWRSERLPGPSVEDLACGLGVDQSTIRRHRASLERKGLLRVIAEGPYNRYDLHPLIDAAVGLDRIGDGLTDIPAPAAAPRPAPDAAPRPCNSPADDRAGLHATKEVEKKVDYDSIPPYPPVGKNVRFRTGGVPDQPEDPDTSPLAAVIGALSAELGDDAPASSATRARNLLGTSDLTTDRFLQLLNEAAIRTRDRQASIVKRCRGDDQASNGMPYLFAILQDLLQPAPPQSGDGTMSIRHRGSDQLGRRRLRDKLALQNRDAARTVPSVHYTEPPPDTIPTPWRAAMEELRSDLTSANYQRWILPTRVLSHEGSLLRIAVADSFDQQWLDVRLRGAIERAISRVSPDLRVEFIVVEAA